MPLHPPASLRSAAARLAALAALLLASIAATAPALAAPFEVAVAPTRLTLAGQPGQRIGQLLRIYNVGAQTSPLGFRTLDWTLDDNGQLALHESLQPGSCRPWVTLERPRHALPPRSDLGFRFQVDIPADAPRGECRFMIAVEGVEPAQQSMLNSGGASLNLPISGRIGVAVYLAVGGARPVLQLDAVGTDHLRHDRQPVIRLRNTGNAHGRLEGTLTAINARGERFELAPPGGPVLPGSTRTLPLQPSGPNADARSLLQYPLDIEGTLEWEDGAFRIKTRLP